MTHHRDMTHGAPVRHPHLFRGFGIRPRYHSKAYDLGYLLSMAFVETSPFDHFFAVFTARKLTKKREFWVELRQRKNSKKYFLPKADQFMLNEPWEVQKCLKLSNFSRLSKS